jgi:excisionase family DNA binding protein
MLLLTFRQAAIRLGISRPTLSRETKLGRIRAVRTPFSSLYAEAALAEWQAAHSDRVRRNTRRRAKRAAA